MLKKCNHDLNKRDTTLIIDEDNETMIYPKRYYAVCRYCEKTFCFIKKDNRFTKR